MADTFWVAPASIRVNSPRPEGHYFVGRPQKYGRGRPKVTSSTADRWTLIIDCLFTPSKYLLHRHHSFCRQLKNIFYPISIHVSLLRRVFFWVVVDRTSRYGPIVVSLCAESEWSRRVALSSSKSLVYNTWTFWISRRWLLLRLKRLEFQWIKTRLHRPVRGYIILSIHWFRTQLFSRTSYSFSR